MPSRYRRSLQTEDWSGCYRWAENRTERYAEIASEFVLHKVDVIVTTAPAAPAAMEATSIPIVLALSGTLWPLD
jgi:hypothetical protein